MVHRKFFNVGIVSLPTHGGSFGLHRTGRCFVLCVNQVVVAKEASFSFRFVVSVDQVFLPTKVSRGFRHRASEAVFGRRVFGLMQFLFLVCVRNWFGSIWDCGFGTVDAFVFGAAGLLPEMRLCVDGIETPVFSQVPQLARQHVIRELLLV